MTFDDKWPVMMVTGAPIPLDLAGEVIRRTDEFFTTMLSPGGNDHEWDQQMIARLHLPDRRPLGDTSPTEFHKKWVKINASHRRWGTIETRYVRNDWISTGGLPDGWCRPDGQIACTLRIGKYPGNDEVLEDWRRIAAAFPSLDLVASVFYDDEVPVPGYSVVVQRGEATLVDPGQLSLHDRFGQIPPLAERAVLIAEMEEANRSGDWSVFKDRGYRHEHATLPAGWIDDWERRGTQVHAQIGAAEREVGALLADAEARCLAGAVDEARSVVLDAIRAVLDRGDVEWLAILVDEVDVDRLDERVVLQILSSTLGVPQVHGRARLVDRIHTQIERRSPGESERILAPFL